MREQTREREAAKGAGAASGYLKAARRYLVAAAGCALFAFVYAQFSHGVYSPFMTFMFAIPLVGGALASLAFHLAKARPAPVLAQQEWALALACLTVASCLRGVFEIAGTSSAFLWAYLPAAAACAAVAIAAFARSRRPSHGATMEEKAVELS